jgi:hypothetical protein
MTPMTDEQWRQLEAAVERVGAKLRALHDGLPSDEDLALHLMLGQGAADTDADVVGYAYPPLLRTIETVRLGWDCSTGTVNPLDRRTWPRPPITV